MRGLSRRRRVLVAIVGALICALTPAALLAGRRGEFATAARCGAAGPRSAARAGRAVRADATAG